MQCRVPQTRAWLSSAPHLVVRPAHLITVSPGPFTQGLAFAGKGRVTWAGRIPLASWQKQVIPTTSHWERRRFHLSILRVRRVLASAGMTSLHAGTAGVAGTGPRWLGALVPLLPAAQSPIHFPALKWRGIVRVGSKPSGSVPSGRRPSWQPWKS